MKKKIEENEQIQEIKENFYKKKVKLKKRVDLRNKKKWELREKLKAKKKTRVEIRNQIKVDAQFSFYIYLNDEVTI